MLRFKAGDSRAFTALYRRHKGPLYRYFLRQTPHDIAEDLYQDTWLRVIHSADRYTASAPFAAYLYRIAHSALVDHWRRSGQRFVDSADDLSLDPVDPGEPADATFDRETLRTRLSAAISRLPPLQRDALLLKEEAGLTLAQIGEVVGANRETVKSRLRYAYDRLRHALRDERPTEERE